MRSGQGTCPSSVACSWVRQDRTSAGFSARQADRNVRLVAQPGLPQINGHIKMAWKTGSVLSDRKAFAYLEQQ